MVAIEIGRVCKKLMGREAGRFCVVIGSVQDGYVDITGPRNITDVRRRKCNILHLEPLEEKLEIGKDASDEDVAKAIETAGLTEKVRSKYAKERPLAGEVPEKERKPKAEKARNIEARKAEKSKAEKPKAEKAEKPKSEKPKSEKPKAEKAEKPKKVKLEKK